MPIHVRNSEFSIVLPHDNTWEWLCRLCLIKEGRDVAMVATFSVDGVWLECPECHTAENIGFLSFESNL